MQSQSSNRISDDHTLTTMNSIIDYSTANTNDEQYCNPFADLMISASYSLEFGMTADRSPMDVMDFVYNNANNSEPIRNSSGLEGTISSSLPYSRITEVEGFEDEPNLGLELLDVNQIPYSEQSYIDHNHLSVDKAADTTPMEIGTRPTIPKHTTSQMEWEEQKTRIHDLYIVRKWRLPKVIAYMKEVHNFDKL
jgi:hypothetical protein